MMKRQAFDFLQSCFEAATDKERISELKFYYPECWQDIIGNNAFIPKGPADDRLIMVDYPDDLQDGYRQVHRVKDEFVYYYNGCHKVTDDELRMYKFRMEWFPEWLAEKLNLDQAEPILDDRVWKLGEIKGVTVLLVRELNPNFDDIADCLFAQSLSSCVVISSQKPKSRYMILPPGFQLLPLGELLPKGPVAVDYNRFLSYVDPDQARLEREGIIWDEHNGILRVLGLDPWLLKGGPARCQLVDQLVQAGKRGAPQILTQLLLEESSSSNLSQFFHKEPRWRDFIGYEPGASGRCWLKAFEELEMFQTSEA
ncbi:hypothetical protein [Endozoicomonas sp. ALC020]|uniref:hypothetical protein n=1 Tax=unclassified Endozoicomonas TaxID=2644528 RepID=UPI003BAF6A35